MPGLIHHGNAKRGKKSPEYLIWVSMRQRCSNPNNKNFYRYGGRGISVCDRWSEFTSFISDVGERPSDKHSLERKDNSKGYEPGNCRWATQSEQARNTSRNVIITVRGKRMTLVEAIEIYGGRYGTVLYRLKKGTPAEEALGIEQKELENVRQS